MPAPSLGFGEDARLAIWVAQRRDELRQGQVRDFVERPAAAELMLGGEPDKNAERSTGRLHDEVGALGPSVVDPREHVAPAIGMIVDLRQAERDRQAGLYRQRGTPVDVLAVATVDDSHRLGRDDLDHAATAARHRASDREQLVVVGERAGHGTSVLRGVRRQAVRREAERAGTHRFFGDARHARDVVGRCQLVGRAPFVHHVRAQRAMRKVRADVDDARLRGQRVEVFGKRLP